MSANPSTLRAPAAAPATEPVQAPVNNYVFLARHPIFTPGRQVYGYELLFRSTANNLYDGVDSIAATAETIHRAIHILGLHTVAGDHRIFVNLAEQLVNEEFYAVLPANQTTVELLETSPPTDELIKACRKLKDDGYQLALDDVCTTGNFGRILELADVIKLDFQAVEREKREALVANLAKYPAKLLAEKVETKEDFDQAIALGCHYLQGYFFCRPEVMRGRNLEGNQAVYVQLLREMSRPELDYNKLEELIKKDVSLSYKILRYLNSAFLGVRHKITSIKQGLVLLGERSIRKWASLVALTSMNRGKPPELLAVCLSRARFCEAVGTANHMGNRQLELFLIGLLSCIDGLLDMPLKSVLQQLAVPAEVSTVLLQEPEAPKDLARIYALTLACEKGAWGKVVEASAGLCMTQSEIAMAYYESLTWADQVLRARE